ncbi:MAG: cation-translocating P-type ATPase, partial [Anaeroplasmataceae bacterium]|nr:cation-translocating P-type ATPase [Anaeroplasmataceae bacterium]
MKRTIEDYAKELDVDIQTGINENNVEFRKKKYGQNQLLKKKKKGILVKIFEQLTDVLIFILLLSSILSILIDPKEWVEAVIILFVVLLNIILGVVQESKAEKSLEALTKLSIPKCKVKRNGQIKEISSQDLVVGDIVYIEAGDLIPADGILIDDSSLMVDESALTGESLPVHKSYQLSSFSNASLSDQKNCVFSSTFVTLGKGTFLVSAVGMNTEIGKIASMIQDDVPTRTPLQKRLDKVSKVIGFLALMICLVVFILELLVGMGALDAFKTSIALAVAAIPEGLAAVVTIVLALGVEKMAKKNAIVKKLPAVETLGSCSIVCSDKTGTLTENKMVITRFYTSIGEAKLKHLTRAEDDILSYFALCSNASIVPHRVGDPTELAIMDCQFEYGQTALSFERIFELPFDSDRKLMTVVCKTSNGYLQITKGAPEVLFTRCKNHLFIEKAQKILSDMSSDALRVLAVAIKYHTTLPKEDVMIEKDLELQGLIGMMDPPRKEAITAIQKAKDAGIQTVMITGDHLSTATSVAKQLKIIEKDEEAVSASALPTLSDEAICKYHVYARVSPKDKVRIVSAFQKQNQIVAMTGDGINDAPALKKADIGCAMGIAGTDVAKEASDMVLVDDKYDTIITAIEEGRSVYENIRKTIQYLLSSNIGEVLTIFLASLLSALSIINLGVPLLPIHLLWVNLITDSLPAFGLGLEKPDESLMKQKPKPKNEGFFSHHMGIKIVLEGIIIGLLTLGAYMYGLLVKDSQMIGQTMAFITLSTCQLFHSYNVKSNQTLLSKKTLNNKALNFSFIVGLVLE